MRLFPRFCAIAAGLAIAACTPKPEGPPPPAPPMIVVPQGPIAANPLDRDLPSYLRLPGLADGATPVRVGIILPFTSTSAPTRALAASMLKAAELAMFAAGNRNMLLMAADEGNGGAKAAEAAEQLLAQGAEVIVGPLFGASVSAVAPIARDRAVPVLAFSTEKNVAGNGAYLLSFLPQNEVRRVVSYAAANGHHQFAALAPQTAYGDVTQEAFRDSVAAVHGTVVGVERFAPNAAAVAAPASAVAKSGADAVLIAQGGVILRAIAPTLSLDGATRDKVKLLGTGLWDDDKAIARESSLQGSWYAAPAPNADAEFVDKYRAAFGSAPAQIASLAYDAVSLVALLSQGTPYHRFTAAALADPNGFAGVNGIFRFNNDGTSERGLAVLEMTPAGPVVVSPAPTTFQGKNS
ncbi:MAG: penicillin-binding protein activator [Alphaproteobacteria bacterium]|nr:penicillin-binding protein activator [Alphaproteobacteria bacterium]